MSDNEIQILSEDQKLGSILKEGARVYINPHKCFDGVDLMKAKWQGLQHLALVVKGWSEVDESFTILWARLVFNIDMCFIFCNNNFKLIFHDTSNAFFAYMNITKKWQDKKCATEK